jgi:hypothetical protein
MKNSMSNPAAPLHPEKTIVMLLVASSSDIVPEKILLTQDALVQLQPDIAMKPT